MAFSDTLNVSATCAASVWHALPPMAQDVAAITFAIVVMLLVMGGGAMLCYDDSQQNTHDADFDDD